MDWAFVAGIMPDLLRGLRVTLIATLGAFAVAALAGLPLALPWRAAWARRAARGCIAAARCTPLLVQLYLVFYVLPGVGVTLPALATGILVLGLHSAAYTAEAYRAGIEAVPPGQWEAARALGLRPRQVWRHVVLPQALPPVLPALGNILVGLFKETPLLAAITVLDVFGTARDIAGQTYRYAEPYALAALLLMAVGLAAAAGVRAVERRLR